MANTNRKARSTKVKRELKDKNSIEKMVNQDNTERDKDFSQFMEVLSSSEVQDNSTLTNFNKGIVSGRTSTRADFLRTATPLALIAALGLPMTSCGVTDSGDDSDLDVNDDDNDDNGNEDSNNGNTGGTSAFSVDGNTITIDTSISGGEALASAGGWLIASEFGFLAVNIDGTRVRAFSDVCTHASCRNAWQYSNSTFICTCHDSVFNTSGEVVSGPADSPLPEYSANINGAIIKITKG
jgi:Rieske Fe-S protein